MASFWLSYNDKLEWNKWLSKFPDHMQDIYYMPDYSQLYLDDDVEPMCFIYCENESIYLHVSLLRKINSKEDLFDLQTPYGYGGPISTDTSTNFIAKAFNRFSEEAINNNIVAEVIKFHPLLGNYKLIEDVKKITLFNVCKTVCVDVQIDNEIRWRKLYTYANRKSINKALRNGTEFHFGCSEKDWEEFLRLYYINLDHNNADSKYYFNKRYFEYMKNSLCDSYMIFSVSIGDEVVSSMIVLLGNSIAHCHLLGTNFVHRNKGVTNYLHHMVIEWCYKEQFDFLHIGGGRTNDDDDSLLRFKKNFSNDYLEFYVGEVVHSKQKYDQLCLKSQNKHSVNAGVIDRYDS